MITKIFLITTLSLSALVSLGQSNFKLTDSTLEVGQIYTMNNIYVDLHNVFMIFDPVTNRILDSITDFLKNNKEFNFEIGVHTDSRGSEKYNLMLSERRADQLKRIILTGGVHKEQLTSKGYGETQPIHSQEMMETNPQLSNDEIDEMHMENRRAVLKVVSQTLPFQYTFDLSDSTFEVGETFTTHGIRFELNKSDLIIDENTQPILDSLVSFFKKHPEMRIELSWHNASLGLKDRSVNYCYHRSRSLYDYFLAQGVLQTQLTPKCYGAEMPIHPDAYIDQFKEADPEKFYQLHHENRRVVLTILTTE